MQLDTRAQARRVMGLFDQGARHAIRKLTAAALAALAAVYLPGLLGYNFQEHGLSPAGQACLGILIFAAICWITEALPAFAVALCVLGLEISILGQPGGVFAADGDTKAWQIFVAPWASPLMWLFLGGFVLAFAASKVGLDKHMASMVIRRSGGKPKALLAGVMGLTFILSMFMSNTATAAMMVALLAPIVANIPKEDKYIPCLYLGIPIAANIGGMGTIIGTPPNAIVVGKMLEAEKLDFAKWMAVALPPALVACVLMFFIICKIYPSQVTKLEIPASVEKEAKSHVLHGFVVVIVFIITVLLWMSGSFFHIPSAVVSFIPITVLAATGVLTSHDMRKLPWDVLLLLGGGLALGVGVDKTGLAQWIAGFVPGGLPFIALILICMAVALLLSNLMSNTATASILAPLAGGLVSVGQSSTTLLVLIGLACSAAMCLPISTPPNAVAYASGKIQVKDFVRAGLLTALIIPICALPWVLWIVPMFLKP